MMLSTNFLAGLTCSWMLPVEKHLPWLGQLCALSRSPHSLSFQGGINADLVSVFNLRSKNWEKMFECLFQRPV